MQVGRVPNRGVSCAPAEKGGKDDVRLFYYLGMYGVGKDNASGKAHMHAWRTVVNSLGFWILWIHLDL